MNKQSYKVLIDKESKHQDSRIPDINGKPIRHASIKRFSRLSHLQAFFAEPFIRSKKSLRVLEIGCGTGGTAIRLAKIGHQVCCIDISRKSIEYARQGAIDYGLQNQISFLIHDASKISKVFKEGEFDAICGIGILHHLRTIESVFKEIKTLNPSILTFIEAVGINPLFNFSRKILIGKTHTRDEHPLLKRDLHQISEIFPGVKMLFGGAIVFHHRLQTRLLNRIDHVVSNFGQFRNLSKTVAIKWEKNYCLQ